MGRASDVTHAATSGATIYINANPFATCSTGAGAGTEADPYCSIQAGVDAAVAGDTVAIIGSDGYFSQQSVTVTTSDISIVGVSNNPGDTGVQSWNEGSFVLDGVHDVTVSNLILESQGVASGSGSPAVSVVGSSNVTFDSDYVYSNDSSNTVEIDGASAGVTVSRTYLDTGRWKPGAAGIAAESGASSIKVAGDVFAAGGITATGVNGLDVVGNTIQRGCSAGIDVEGSSSGVSIENNVVEDANPNTDYAIYGYKSNCEANSWGWSPDITVAQTASAGTTADYNDFYNFGSDATAPYGWAGVDYPTLAAFQAAVPQAVHDTLDTVESVERQVRYNQSADADLILMPGSAAIDSANPTAPGALTSDYFGVSPYTSRGAEQYVNADPNLAIALNASDTSAFGVSLSMEITTTPIMLSLTVAWGDGSEATSNQPGGNGVPVMSHTYATLGAHTITVSTSDGLGESAQNSVTITLAGAEYTAYGPVRILDTRSGLGAATGVVPAGKAVRVKVGGNGSIPVGVTAAVVNITVTDPSGNGFVTAYADGSAVPTTSNVNYGKGQTVPNMAIVPVGGDGYVDLYNAGANGASVDLVADISGYFTQSQASGYASVTPYRLVDTRNGTGVAKGHVASGGSISVPVAAALPAGVSATAVAVNITATDGTGAGVLTAYPDGETKPSTSNVNYAGNQNIANSAVIPVGADGRIDIANALAGGSGSADIVVDVAGYYSAAGQSAYLSVSPFRYLDTRSSTWKDGPLEPGAAHYFALPMGLDSNNADQTSITGFVVNATVTQTAGSGYLAVAPDPNTYLAYQNGTAVQPTPPTASTLNWTKGQTVPNLAQVSTGSTGIVDFWNLGGPAGSTALVIDVFGYYQND